MSRHCRSRTGRAALGTLPLILPLLLSAALALPAKAAGPADWLTWDPSTHRVALTLIASYNAARGGLNFNGYSTGTMLISVPVGTRVEVTFHNNGPLPHSALVRGYAARARDGLIGFPLAFAGAHTANPRQGTPAGRTERVSFVADRVGRYALVCSVGRHAKGGMWDTFVVTRGGAPYLEVPQH